MILETLEFVHGDRGVGTIHLHTLRDTHDQVRCNSPYCGDTGLESESLAAMRANPPIIQGREPWRR